MSDDGAVQLERRTRAEVFAGGVALAAGPFVVAEPVPPHVHDFVELALVVAGVGSHTTADGTDRLSPGDVVVVRPGAWHAWTPEAGVQPLAVTNAYLGPETLHQELGWVLDDPRLARLLLVGGRLPVTLPPFSRDRVAGWLGQLAEERRGPDRLLATGLVQCALVEMSRAVESRAPGTAPPALTGPVRDVLRLLTDDLARPWTVRELASQVRLSPSSLYRQFHEQLGSGPVERLTLMRAEAAATLLVQTDLPVAAVGRLVGWPDPSYVSRRFRLVHQVSPAAYRRAHGVRGRSARTGSDPEDQPCPSS
jgi:AraC-like DNA-binding protein/mannose-6-phosphate isomerase-like protein (cupin superfamily)